MIRHGKAAHACGAILVHLVGHEDAVPVADGSAPKAFVSPEATAKP
jgi:hypothetical protein